MAKAKNISVYKIENDVPVPEDAQRPSIRAMVPIDELEVGDSVEFPLRLRTTVATTATRLKREGKVFTIKKIDEKSARIWRVE